MCMTSRSNYEIYGYHINAQLRKRLHPSTGRNPFNYQLQISTLDQIKFDHQFMHDQINDSHFILLYLLYFSFSSSLLSSVSSPSSYLVGQRDRKSLCYLVHLCPPKLNPRMESLPTMLVFYFE